jgi:hypothetical protein
MRECPGCRRELEAEFRFCPWCGITQRRKLVEFFLAHPAIADDRRKALRVSAYLDPAEEQHVRFTVWDIEGTALAAVSLSPEEAARLVRFLEEAGEATGRLPAVTAPAGPAEPTSGAEAPGAAGRLPCS